MISTIHLIACSKVNIGRTVMLTIVPGVDQPAMWGSFRQTGLCSIISQVLCSEKAISGSRTRVELYQSSRFKISLHLELLFPYLSLIKKAGEEAWTSSTNTVIYWFKPESNPYTKWFHEAWRCWCTQETEADRSLRSRLTWSIEWVLSRTVATTQRNPVSK